MRCGVTIPSQWKTGRRGVGVARPAQWVEEQVHALPWAKCGELQDRVEGVIYVGSARGGNSIGCGVDGGVGSGVVSANKPHWS